jgi:predicted MarR family transcription regulator
MDVNFNLDPAQLDLLRKIANGARLKDQRDIEGRKWFTLYNADDSHTRIDAALVESLVTAGLIDSNKKFPAATYWLTEKGKNISARQP